MNLARLCSGRRVTSTPSMTMLPLSTEKVQPLAVPSAVSSTSRFMIGISLLVYFFPPIVSSNMGVMQLEYLVSSC